MTLQVIDAPGDIVQIRLHAAKPHADRGEFVWRVVHAINCRPVLTILTVSPQVTAS